MVGEIRGMDPLGTASFRGQVAVVTGAGSGIGKAIALGLAEKGVLLCLVGRRMEMLESVATAARKHATKVVCCPSDLTADESFHVIPDCVKSDFGHVDLLLHCAGTITLGRMESASLEAFDRQYRTNVRAPFALTKALLPMLKTRRGQIVFINSSAGINAMPNVGQYAATKHALKAVADSLRAEVHAEGVRVLSVYPGRTATPMRASIHEMQGMAYAPERLMQPEDVAAAVLHALGLPRTAEVTDIHIRPMMTPLSKGV
jgi:NADP-dependent 3-hydroxy acid dehydrogenase YdfG